ncbi:MAG: saccharopine dehydrogenase family protein [Jatrophihabitans sp.]|uniref:saccharopine dehydrogenase family protein n=1 Tax=Jatrophihabitans sp. TaxID=1932789 RepID=UPI003F8003C8
MPTDARDHDIVLFGATGFAGRLTAEYLALAAPAGCRWALAGRSRTKLAAVRDGLAALNPSLADLPLLEADVDDVASVRRVAEATKVLATTVGPYVLHGHGVVAACAEAGTDYLDLTGEPEFVDATWLRQHAVAERTGARLVHAAGFDSIPHDLGTWFTVKQLPEDVPLTVRGYVRASGMFSGGTFASALTAFSRARANVVTARARRAAESVPGDRRVHAELGRPHRDPLEGDWSLPFPSLDPQIIVRSARAVPRYGPDFTYSHYAAIGRLATAAGVAAGVGTLAGLAQIPPARKALMRLQPAGQGPSAERRARSWFSVTFLGEGGGERVVTRVSGGDPGYDETAKMLAESALCLAHDDLPQTAGQVTTAQAMGDALLDRLQKAGIAFDVLG